MAHRLTLKDLEAARAAVAYARQVRLLHARKTEREDPQRQADIRQALRRLRTGMQPLRSAIGAFSVEPRGEQATKRREMIYALSAEMQAERRKLWKMQVRK